MRMAARSVELIEISEATEATRVESEGDDRLFVSPRFPPVDGLRLRQSHFPNNLILLLSLRLDGRA